MSDSITNAMVLQFNQNVYMLSQQKGSKLRHLLRQKTTHAKKDSFDRMAPATRPQVKISRHQDTPLSLNIHDRRWQELLDFVHADLVDQEDEIRILIDPASIYAQNFAMAFGREYDHRIVAAMTADSDNGQFGGTAAVFPTGNTLASGGTGLTAAKIREYKRRLDDKDVSQERRVAVVSPQAMEDMLAITEITSSDYNTVKALVQGTMEGNTWMGFQWVVLSPTILPIDGSLDRSCFFFQQDGMGFMIGKDFKTSMDRRADKMNALQIMCTATFNAVRIDDDCVLQVLVRESA